RPRMRGLMEIRYKTDTAKNDKMIPMSANNNPTITQKTSLEKIKKSPMVQELLLYTYTTRFRSVCKQITGLFFSRIIVF
ncbi:MAG: hypothetical protein K2O99_07960, partial [Lachnospiraceae bacterium]|nr:hypothetical protein [Lachnospiraceae bacterium]